MRNVADVLFLAILHESRLDVTFIMLAWLHQTKITCQARLVTSHRNHWWPNDFQNRLWFHDWLSSVLSRLFFDEFQDVARVFLSSFSILELIGKNLDRRYHGWVGPRMPGKERQINSIQLAFFRLMVKPTNNIIFHFLLRLVGLNLHEIKFGWSSL